jgi:hypothetical protein
MTSVINFINTGTSANAGNGDSLRTAFNKINSNFVSLEDSYVRSGVSSFNGQGGIITFTATEIASVLGFVPYSAANPNGYVTSSTVFGLASLDYVNRTFVTSATGATFATTLYVNSNLSQYPTLQYLTNAQYVNASNISGFLTDYYTKGGLAAAGYITTSTLIPYLKLVNGDILPSTTATNNIGNSGYTWNNLYLAGSVFLGTNTLRFDPTTNRLLVNGNDVTGGYVFTPSAIYNVNSNTFSLSSNYNAIDNATGSAGIIFPSNTDIISNAIKLQIYNTGSSGISIRGKYSSITVDDANADQPSGITISGKVITPITFSGKSISQYNTSDSSLILTTPSSLGMGFPTEHRLISYLSTTTPFSYTTTGTTAPFSIYGSRITLSTYVGPEYFRSTYVGLNQNGLHIGYSKTNGQGDPANHNYQADNSIHDPFFGYVLPLTPGLPGQVLTQGPATDGTGFINTVYWTTATDANVNSQIATINTATIKKTFTLGTDGLRFNDNSLMTTAYGNQQVSDFLPQYSGALSVGYIAGLGTHVDIISNGLMWAFSATGVLSLPYGGQIGELYGNGVDIRANPSGYVKLVSNSGNNYIKTDNLGAYVFATNNQWSFGTDGRLTFPDTSIQATAFIPADYVSIAGIKALVATCTTFGEFKTAIANIV